MDDVLHGRDDVTKLEWGLGRKKEEESLVGYPFPSIMNYLARDKSEGF